MQEHRDTGRRCSIYYLRNRRNISTSLKAMRDSPLISTLFKYRQIYYLTFTEQCSTWYSLSLCGLLTNPSVLHVSTSQVVLAGLGFQPGSGPQVYVVILTDIRQYCTYLGGYPRDLKAAFTCTHTVASGVLHTVLPTSFPLSQKRGMGATVWSCGYFAKS